MHPPPPYLWGKRPFLNNKKPPYRGLFTVQGLWGYYEVLRCELPPSKLGGICGANSHIFVAQIRFAAPKDAACHPTLRFIPAASCRVFSLAFINLGHSKALGGGLLSMTWYIGRFWRFAVPWSSGIESLPGRIPQPSALSGRHR